MKQVDYLNSRLRCSNILSAVGTLHYQLLRAQVQGFQMLAPALALHLPTIDVQVFHTKLGVEF